MCTAVSPHLASPGIESGARDLAVPRAPEGDPAPSSAPRDKQPDAALDRFSRNGEATDKPQFIPDRQYHPWQRNSSTGSDSRVRSVRRFPSSSAIIVQNTRGPHLRNSLILHMALADPPAHSCRARLDGSGFVFPSPAKPGRPLSNMALTKVLRDNGLAEQATVHGSRSSFKTWSLGATNTPTAVVEMAMRHTEGDDVEQAYIRTDLYERRAELMHAWATHVAGQWPTPEPPPNPPRFGSRAVGAAAA